MILTKKMEDMSNNESSAKIALRVLELVAQGSIDRTDAVIMSMRLEWPRPSNREIARRTGTGEATIRRRLKAYAKMSCVV
jgi:DNA-binding Lrp family transcriptional regulator